MDVLDIIGGVLLLLVSVAIIILVTVQESPKGTGVSALTGSDSYYNKNQGRTMDAMLTKLTKYCGIAFFVLAITVYAIDIYLK